MRSVTLFTTLFLTALTYVQSHHQYEKLSVDAKCIPQGLPRWIDEAFPPETLFGKLHTLTSEGLGQEEDFSILRKLKPDELELVLTHPTLPTIPATMDCELIKTYYRGLATLPADTRTFLYGLTPKQRTTFGQLVNTPVFHTLLENMRCSHRSKAHILMDTFYSASQCPPPPQPEKEDKTEEKPASEEEESTSSNAVRITAVTGAMVMMVGSTLLM
ncbi:hypothetical protein HMI54_003628 [Coelomomyces lativittatus]|nr:hypothetical protein HMI56_003201 [Coelomomyces lativittatus]KAJ1506879.1 hypothetical protein HMI55_000996 [Coelomomyces lativittatus]KAJ1507996.1 hypothetical protein HMI54_003628 [Coelomomyces lativittatus]